MIIMLDFQILKTFMIFIDLYIIPFVFNNVQNFVI